MFDFPLISDSAVRIKLNFFRRNNTDTRPETNNFKDWSKKVVYMSFPNLYSLNLMENVMRSRKDQKRKKKRRIHKDLGKENSTGLIQLL